MMRRYVVYALGLLYADRVLPDQTSSVIEVCRLADLEVGEVDNSYKIVPRGDPLGEYEVFAASPSLPASLPALPLEDLTYVATVTTQKRDPL